MSLFFYKKAPQRRQKNYYICNRLYQTRNRMTFEEFFTKKKIDLKALKAADEPLFEEFRAHYYAMGEKSFDHSKKFWFNKLRKSYHLAEEEASLIKKPVQKDHVETAPAPSETTAAKPTGFKPRFKATAPTEPADQKEEPKTAPTNSTAGFKPRFKPGITKNTATTTETSTPTDPSDDTAPEAAKPTGFKPRFKPGVTKVAEPVQPAASTFDEAGPANPSVKPQQGNTAETDTTAANKPAGFKPRFKSGVTKTGNTDSSQTKPATVENTVDKQQQEASEQEPTIAKPSGFTPRFKAGITKTGSTDNAQAAEPVQSASSSVADATPADTSSPAEASGSSATEISKPTGFRPRFKAGITKAANTDSEQQVAPPTEDLSAKQTVDPAPQATPTLTESNMAKPTGEPQQNDDTAQEQATTNKPTGFKPRFKAGLTKIDKKEE